MRQQHSPISATLVAVDPAVAKKRLSNKLAGYQIKAQLIPRISIAPFMQEWQMDFAHAVEASLLLSLRCRCHHPFMWQGNRGNELE